jgi:predicted RNA-binding Zn-ribbon protein involved in translation (DUF1610 family)
MSKPQPIINSCFTCGSKVVEFEDNQFGCSTCGSIWSYFEDETIGWNVINENEVKPKHVWQALLKKRKLSSQSKISEQD